VIPTVLLTVGVVYCQMHYGVDALTGLTIGVAVPLRVAPLSRARRLTKRARKSPPGMKPGGPNRVPTYSYCTVILPCIPSAR
jgi:hypothetical protein